MDATMTRGTGADVARLLRDGHQVEVLRVEGDIGERPGVVRAVTADRAWGQDRVRLERGFILEGTPVRYRVVGGGPDAG